MVESPRELKAKDSLARNLRRLRLDEDISQTELAVMLGVNVAHISRVEAGKYWPSVEFLVRVCEAFSVKADWLLAEPTSSPLRDHELENMIETIRTFPPRQRRELARVIPALADGFRITQIAFGEHLPSPREDLPGQDPADVQDGSADSGGSTTKRSGR